MKKKLVLNKKTITELSHQEQSKILGGEAAWTTSFGSCTGGVCCSPQPTLSQVRMCESDNLPNGCPKETSSTPPA